MIGASGTPSAGIADTEPYASPNIPPVVSPPWLIVSSAAKHCHWQRGSSCSRKSAAIPPSQPVPHSKTVASATSALVGFKSLPAIEPY